MQKQNIIPRHDMFQTMGSGHTSLYSPYASSAKAFLDFQTISASHTLKQSGYQYSSGLTITLTVPATSECSNTADSGVVNYTLYALEPVDSSDKLFSGIVPGDATSPLTDHGHINYKFWADETVDTTDESVTSSQIPQETNVNDSSFISYVIYASEVVSSSSPEEVYQSVDIRDSVVIKSCKTDSVYDTTSIGVSGVSNVYESTTIGVVPSELTSVSNASGYYVTSPNNPIVLMASSNMPTNIPTPGDVTTVYVSNPFEPTIIIGGQVYSTHVSTAPPVYGPQTYFVQWLDVNLPGGNNSSNLQDFSFNLNFTGGSFSILSENPIGSLGSTVNLFGLTGTITKTGMKLSNGAYGYTSKGIFGSPLMNKEFNIINYGNVQYFQFTSNQILYPLSIDNNKQPTVWDMARNIATFSGVRLGYYVVDCPYTDVLSQSGLTGLEALSSLASQVGGQVRFNGIDKYILVYPDFYSGRWVVPNSALITAEGVEDEQVLDLGLGVTGTGVLSIPKANIEFPTDTGSVPGGGIGVAPENVETLATITKPFTPSDPKMIIDLPVDTESVKIQILVGGQALGAGQYVTKNESIWFDLGSPSPFNKFAKAGVVGGVYKIQSHIDYTLFPNLAAINNGNFVMRIGVVRRELTEQFEQAQQEAQSELKDLIQRMLANIRYIKTYEGTISCFFFGSIPLPGQWASATVCGRTVEGIIESVNFSAPGILTIQVAKYFRVNLLDPKVNYAIAPSDLEV